MGDKPILFSAPMVRSLLSGAKTRTRRPVKHKGELPPTWATFGQQLSQLCGDQVWRPSRIFYWSEEQPDSGPLKTLRRWPCIGDPALRDWYGIPCPYGKPGDLLWVRETCQAEELSRPPVKRAATRKERDAYGRTTVIELDEADGLDGVRYVADDAFRPIENTPDAGEAWSDLFHYRGHNGSRVGAKVVSIHMPRWASRLTLEITDVRVERLQDISEADAVAEGIYRSATDEEGRAWFRAYHEEQTGEPPSQADLDQFNEGVWKAPGVRQGWGSTQAERDQDQWHPNAPGAYGLLWKAINGEESWAANPWVWDIEFSVHHQNIDAFLSQRGAS